jgi:hypothetical protein
MPGSIPDGLRRDSDSLSGLFLRMGRDVFDEVRVVDDLEIEPPALGNPRLPLVLGFVVLFRVE